MWTWVVIVVGYGFSLFAFHLLGGVNAAADGIAGWARVYTTRRLEQTSEDDYLATLERIARDAIPLIQ